MRRKVNKMADELLAQVRDIQTRIEASQRERIRAEQDRDKAKSVVEQARHTLEKEFGVTDPQSASQVLELLERDVKTELASVQEALAKIGV